MIVSNQEIAIYLKNVRNLSGYTNARFICRISLSAQTSAGEIKAIPVNIIEKQSIKNENRSQFDEQSFITKTFAIKMGAHVEINEIFVFKLALPLDNQAENLTKLRVTVQLIQIDSVKNKIIGTYKGTIHGNSINSYMEIDFYDGSPCQILGTIHSCSYKFQFHHDEQSTDLKTFCQRYCSYNIDEILEYLKNESSKYIGSLIDNYKAINQKTLKVNCMDIISKRFLKIYQKDVAERSTELASDDEQTVAQEEKVQPITKRRRIFSTIKEHKSQKYQTYEMILHENSQKIYTIWRQLLASLFTIQGDKFIYHHRHIYHKKLREKVGESIARFKGSWDLDIYCQEENLRSKLASQLRSKNEALQQQLQNKNMFDITNQIFFSKVRPIFFEEKAEQAKHRQMQPPEDILVILVHGLGACRLDMQKIKVELRRYYDNKVRFYTSSTNQGRTEGDIQSMGNRLAAELDYQFIKYSILPKLCFVGHSMGGLIIRSALPRLQKYKESFHSLITLSSPHLGYLYSTSKLVDAGLWFLNAMKKCTSIMQMTMQDEQVLQETFLYKLSKKAGLQWFKKIIFLASHQDLYVPYHSARIQKNQQSIYDAKKRNKKGLIYSQMIQNILGQVNCPVIRLNVNFCIPQQNFDNLIGRAAHISFINNVEMVRTFVLSGHHYFF